MTESIVALLGKIGNYIWLVFLASSGGYLNYLIECQKEGVEPTWRDGLIKIFGAAFTGVIAIYACLYFDVGVFGTGMIAGICGYGGPLLLDFALGLVKSKARAMVKAK